MTSIHTRPHLVPRNSTPFAGSASHSFYPEAFVMKERVFEQHSVQASEQIIAKVQEASEVSAQWI